MFKSDEEEGERVKGVAQLLPGWILILKRMRWVEKTKSKNTARGL